MKPFFFYSPLKNKDTNNKQTGPEKRVALAGIIENNNLLIAATCCSEKDQFSKKKAREKLIKKLNVRNLQTNEGLKLYATLLDINKDFKSSDFVKIAKELVDEIIFKVEENKKLFRKNILNPNYKYNLN